MSNLRLGLLLAASLALVATVATGCGSTDKLAECPLAGSTKCGSTCVNVQEDQLNCGSCGNACPAGQACVAGACSLTCAPSQTRCGTGASAFCTNTLTDVANCGGCGTACPAGNVCSMGGCALSCQAGLTNCFGVCRDLNSDVFNCGGCGAPCPAGSVCSMGGCALSCQMGLTDCGGSCRDLATDDNNCGACGLICGPHNTCSGGACAAISPPIFDSLTGPILFTTRLADSSCGTLVTIGAASVAITAIGVYNNLTSAGSLKFMVFSHPAHALLLITGAQPVAAGGPSWKVSNSFAPFTLTAGAQYDIGAISDSAGQWGFDTVIETSGSMASTSQNPNFATFASPTVTGQGAADCGILLY